MRGRGPGRGGGGMRLLALGIGIVAILVLVVLGLGRPGPGPAGPGPTAAARTQAASIGDPATTIDPLSGLPTIRQASLPPEARATLALIAAGGPFLHGADGAVFENRERLLPVRQRGSYHEYTVETPGSADRGARRIVTGGPDEAYWTDDHYGSFARIVP